MSSIHKEIWASPQKNYIQMAMGMGYGSNSMYFTLDACLCRSNIGMWIVYPEAMAGNVGVLCSDISLGERILR